MGSCTRTPAHTSFVMSTQLNQSEHAMRQVAREFLASCKTAVRGLVDVHRASTTLSRVVKAAEPRRGGWEDEVSDNPFAPSDWCNLAAESSWVGDIVPLELRRGRVWQTAHTHERGDKRWIHRWFVLEAGAEVIRVHEYFFDKG